MRRSNAVAIVMTLICGFLFHRAGCTLIDFRPSPSSSSSVPIDPSKNPLQENFPDTEEVPITKAIGERKILILPKAKFLISGRVVSKKHYYADWNAKLSPVDLALAWGPMASKNFDQYVSYSHSDRYYMYKYSPDFPATQETIAHHTANEHLIPANVKIEKALKSIKIDEVVELEGFLVNVETDKGEILTTSLVRTDTGAGACEIIYVTKVRINNDVFQ